MVIGDEGCNKKGGFERPIEVTTLPPAAESGTSLAIGKMFVPRSFRFLSLTLAFSHANLPFGSALLDPLLNPLEDSLGTIISGGGLIEGTLGAVQGILGVDQR